MGARHVTTEDERHKVQRAMRAGLSEEEVGRHSKRGLRTLRRIVIDTVHRSGRARRAHECSMPSAALETSVVR